MRFRILKSLLAIFCFILLALDLATPINLTAVDIGRHIKNGELIVSGHWDVLHTNFYSFTYPDFSFINHHWFFGVMAYKAHQLVGFAGLSLLYISILLLTLFFFLRAAQMRGSFALAIFFAFISLPILSDRQEIRPEGLSILFMSVYFYLLTKLSLGKIKSLMVFLILGVLQVIWVNTHIFFFMGPFLVLIFLMEGTLRGCKPCVRNLVPLFFMLLVLNILNPSGFAGALTPLNIFKEFGYRLAENQNIFFMMKRFPNLHIYSYYMVMAGIALIGIVWVGLLRGWKSNIALILLMLFALIAGFKAVRLMTPFGFFFVALSTFFYAQILGTWPQEIQKKARTVLLVLALSVGIAHAMVPRPNLGIGLAKGVDRSAEFFKQLGLKGPIFSNYDIGGYLIYYLANQEKVFVDNRQEAFPPDFFKEVYIPMQEDNKIWQDIDGRYGFNVIYFYRHDLTPWGQNFLVERINDLSWAPVYVDLYTIIFLKRNTLNQILIERFELPKSMFGVERKS